MYIMKYDQKEYKSPIVTIVYPHHNLNSWTGYYVHESICNWNENVKCIYNDVYTAPMYIHFLPKYPHHSFPLVSTFR